MQPRPARAPYVLKFGSRRISRRMMPEAIVPYLRMSGRWLAENGFAIGSHVQVLVENGRVTLVSAAAEASRPVALANDGRAAMRSTARVQVPTGNQPGTGA
jgi:hypothetical protein